MYRTEEITGVLMKAQWDPHANVVWGFIYNDINERWPDGALVRTSLVVSHESGQKPEFIKTLNSLYRVEWRPNEAKTSPQT